jgi:hypothetical protein
MHDKVGAFYMSCVASEMAEQMSTPLYTDSPSDAEVGQTLLFSPRSGDPVSDILIPMNGGRGQRHRGRGTSRSHPARDVR